MSRLDLVTFWFSVGCRCAIGIVTKWCDFPPCDVTFLHLAFPLGDVTFLRLMWLKPGASSELYIARCPRTKPWKTPKKKRRNGGKKLMSLQKTIRQNSVRFFPYIHGIRFHGILLTLLFLNSWYSMGLLNSFGWSAFRGIFWQVKKTHGVSKTIWHVSIVFSGGHGLLFRHLFQKSFCLIRGFTYFLTFTPIPCEVIQFDEHIWFFKMGRGKTHQLAIWFFVWLVSLRSPKGILHFIADISGWWNLYTWDSETWQLKWGTSRTTVRVRPFVGFLEGGWRFSFDKMFF